MSLPSAKELLAEAESAGGGVVKIWQRLSRVLETIDKHTKQLEAQATEIRALREAVLSLQAREAVLLARSETAAVQIAAQTIADLARRIGHLEAQSGDHKAAR